MRILGTDKPQLQPTYGRSFGTAATTGGAPSTPVMPDRVASLLADPKVQKIRVGQSHLSQAWEGVLRFRFVGNGPLAERTVEGETPSTEALLAGARGPAVRDALHGVLEVLGRRNQPTVLTGLTMATNPDAFIANLVVSDAEQRINAGERPTARDLQSTASELVRSGIEQAYGVYDGAGWMHLDPSTSSEFHERVDAGPNAPVRQGEFVATLQHELEHAVTPSEQEEFERVPWLEEAGAELLTQWSGAIGEMSKGLHINQVSSGEVAYEPQVKQLTQWIRRTGLDPKRAEDLAAVRDLLQSGTLGQTPGRIAAAIVAHEGRGDAKALARAIELDFSAGAFFG